MTEMEPNLPPELKSALTDLYFTPPPDPAFTLRLEVQLRQRQAKWTAPANLERTPLHIQERNPFTNRQPSRLVVVVIAATLALLLLSGFAYAVGWLHGFIPGIGFVKDVRSVLPTPVVVERTMLPSSTPQPANTPSSLPDQATPTIAPVEAASSQPTVEPRQEKKGLMLTVQQVVAEASRLVIVYKIDGYPADFFGPEHAQKLNAFVLAHPDDPIQEQVRLPDGSFLDHVNGGGCDGGGDLSASWLTCQSIYAPLPGGVSQFTLAIHRLQNALPGELPEDWAIPIQLAPVLASQAATGVEELNLSSQKINGITLRLLKVNRSSAQTAFQLGVEWEGQNQMLDHIDPITLQDDQGRSYPLTIGPEGDHWSPDHPNQITFASMVTDLAGSGRPLTFRANFVWMTESDEATLHFDPGKNAKIGQDWPMDQVVHVGGFDLHFTRARLKNDADGSPQLEFDIQTPSPTDILSMPMFADGSLSSASELDPARGMWVSGVSLPAVPTRPIDLRISLIQYQVNGPWEITWQP
jgi:hypothetical protein